MIQINRMSLHLNCFFCNEIPNILNNKICFYITGFADYFMSTSLCVDVNCSKCCKSIIKNNARMGDDVGGFYSTHTAHSAFQHHGEILLWDSQSGLAVPQSHVVI